MLEQFIFTYFAQFCCHNKKKQKNKKKKNRDSLFKLEPVYYTDVQAVKYLSERGRERELDTLTSLKTQPVILTSITTQLDIPNNLI